MVFFVAVYMINLQRYFLGKWIGLWPFANRAFALELFKEIAPYVMTNCFLAAIYLAIFPERYEVFIAKLWNAIDTTAASFIWLFVIFSIAISTRFHVDIILKLSIWFDYFSKLVSCIISSSKTFTLAIPQESTHFIFSFNSSIDSYSTRHFTQFTFEINQTHIAYFFHLNSLNKLEEAVWFEHTTPFEGHSNFQDWRHNPSRPRFHSIYIFCIFYF